MKKHGPGIYQRINEKRKQQEEKKWKHGGLNLLSMQQ
jgi:hypothetical protein